MLLPLVLLALQLNYPQKFEKAQEFVAAVAEKMPLWDADALGQFERPEIAKVKEDIEIVKHADGADAYLVFAQQLHDDWDALLALDAQLKTRYVI